MLDMSEFAKRIGYTTLFEQGLHEPKLYFDIVRIGGCNFDDYPATENIREAKQTITTF